MRRVPRYGKPRNAGVNKMKATRNLRSIAEERVGRKIGGLRVLNSYWCGEDARHRWYEVRAPCLSILHSPGLSDSQYKYACIRLDVSSLNNICVRVVFFRVSWLM